MLVLRVEVIDNETHIYLPYFHTDGIIYLMCEQGYSKILC